MDPEKRSRIMVSIRSVSRLELRAKAMAESLAGCRLRRQFFKPDANSATGGFPR
jgi:ribosomal protein S3